MITISIGRILQGLWESFHTFRNFIDPFFTFISAAIRFPTIVGHLYFIKGFIELIANAATEHNAAFVTLLEIIQAGKIST